MQSRGFTQMSKWDRWYENQNDATKAWLDTRAKEDNKFALSIMLPSLSFGLLIGFIIGFGIGV